jgi:hypothetical protein
MRGVFALARRARRIEASPWLWNSKLLSPQMSAAFLLQMVTEHAMKEHDHRLHTSVSQTPRVRLPWRWDTDQGHRPSQDLDNRVGNGHGAENQRSIDEVGEGSILGSWCRSRCQ